MVYHSHDSYLIIGEVREAFGTPITGFDGVESYDFSLSRHARLALVACSATGEEGEEGR